MNISLPRYSGKAALVNGILAHHGPLDLFTVGKEYILNNVRYRVLYSKTSAYVPNVTLVSLQEL